MTGSKKVLFLQDGKIHQGVNQCTKLRGFHKLLADIGKFWRSRTSPMTRAGTPTTIA